MDGIRNCITRRALLRTHGCRADLHNIVHVARLSARGIRRNNLRATIAKVTAHSGIQGYEWADKVAQSAAVPAAVTDRSQLLGIRPLENICWLRTHKYVSDAAKAQAAAGQVPHADHLSPDDMAAGMAVRPPGIVCRHAAHLWGAQPTTPLPPALAHRWV